MRTNKKAFSLVELSIVLVILGLLVGGVLTGQSLIHAAELRSVTTEYTRWVTASRTFRDKYFALAGDMPNATSFWGAATCPGDLSDARTGITTCNGNSDGVVVAGSVTGGTNTSNEAFNFWQHLANAGLIEGSYSGVPDFEGTTNVNIVRRGWNAPAAKLSGATSWAVEGPGSISISTVSLFIEGEYGNALILGESSGGNGAYAPVMKPEDAWNIDTKLDDGKAGAGNIVVREHNSGCYLLADGSLGTISTTVARTDIQHNLTLGSIACALVFKNAI